MTTPKNFVLLHGAFHGGWCWEQTAGILRARGHHVTTPTQTGLGERSHLMRPGIDLETFGMDLVNHLRFEDLNDVILVGHSFAGSPLSVAAEREAARIARLVYLDARVLIAGETGFHGHPPDLAEERRALAQESSDGLSIPPPPAAVFGVIDPDQAAWVEARLTPHPLDTFDSPIPITGPPGAALPKEYIVCTDPIYEPLESSRDRVREAGWPMREIATGHDAMVSDPVGLADMLDV